MNEILDPRRRVAEGTTMSLTETKTRVALSKVHPSASTVPIMRPHLKSQDPDFYLYLHQIEQTRESELNVSYFWHQDLLIIPREIKEMLKTPCLTMLEKFKNELLDPPPDPDLHQNEMWPTKRPSTKTLNNFSSSFRVILLTDRQRGEQPPQCR